MRSSSSTAAGSWSGGPTSGCSKPAASTPSCTRPSTAGRASRSRTTSARPGLLLLAHLLVGARRFLLLLPTGLALLVVDLGNRRLGRVLQHVVVAGLGGRLILGAVVVGPLCVLGWRGRYEHLDVLDVRFPHGCRRRMGKGGVLDTFVMDGRRLVVGERPRVIDGARRVGRRLGLARPPAGGLSRLGGRLPRLRLRLLDERRSRFGLHPGCRVRAGGGLLDGGVLPAS